MPWLHDEKAVVRLLWGLAAAVLLHDVVYLLAGLSSPALGPHGFRQTQTALTAYWIRYDGPRLAYETPVLGAPWSIPFEFPLYQWLVALLFRLGLSIESAGRLVSFAFLLGCVWPFAVIRRALRLPPVALPLMTILFLAAPIYAFWGRAVLIETCALFLALLWLGLVLNIVSVGRAAPVAIVSALAVGCLAVLQKSTTFAAFAVIGGGALVAALAASLRGRDLRRSACLAGVGVATCIVPLAVAIAWIAYTDHVKAENPLGRSLTSTALATFNYGTWAQRHSLDLLIALWRAVTDTLGANSLAAIATIVLCAILLRSVRWPIIVGVLAFLLPFAIFTNLHILHDYYQVANAVFLLAALAFALAGLFARGMTVLAILVLIAVVAGQLVFFAKSFAPAVLADYHRSPGYRISLLTRENVPADQAIIVDIGDYSSIINFYSQRKGVAIPRGLSADLVDRIFADPSRFLGGMKAAAIVSCSHPPDGDPTTVEITKRIEHHLAGRRVLAEAGVCRLLAIDDPSR